MFISLQQLEKRPVRFHLEIPAGEIEYDSAIVQSSLLHSEGFAQLINHSLGEVRVQGKLKVGIEAVCDRCLESARFQVDNNFDLVYMPERESMNGEDEIDREGIEVGFYQGDGLELNDVLREVVLLAIPMQFVCDEACKGICPKCGQNRNQSDCGCHGEAVDERWSRLKELRSAIGSQN